MTPVLVTAFELISILSAAAAAIVSMIATLRKAHGRLELSKELSKYQDLIKQYESSSAEEKRDKIVELSRLLSQMVSALPKGDQPAVISALQQPSESGRSHYTEQVAHDALRLEPEKSTSNPAQN